VKQFPAGTRTAVDAANAIGCDVGQIVKSLVFVAADRPVVALVSGANRLDERRLELAALGLYWWHPAAWWARRELREAEEQRCDAGVVAALPAVVWAAAGRPDSVFEIDPERLCELSGAVVADLKVNS